MNIYNFHFEKGFSSLQHLCMSMSNVCFSFSICFKGLLCLFEIENSNKTLFCNSDLKYKNVKENLF